MRKFFPLLFLCLALLSCRLSSPTSPQRDFSEEDGTVRPTLASLPVVENTETSTDISRPTSIPQPVNTPKPIITSEPVIKPPEFQEEKWQVAAGNFTFNKDLWDPVKGDFRDCLVLNTDDKCQICKLMPMGITPGKFRYEDYSETFYGIKFDFVMYISNASDQPSFSTVRWGPSQKYQYEIMIGDSGWDCYDKALDVFEKSAQLSFQ